MAMLMVVFCSQASVANLIRPQANKMVLGVGEAAPRVKGVADGAVDVVDVDREKGAVVCFSLVNRIVRTSFLLVIP